MKFTKAHGLGNDFVILDGWREPSIVGGTLPPLARSMCERSRGVGADQLLTIEPPSDAGRRAGATIRMRVFNADGGEAEMCGNGIRCVARIAAERGHSPSAAPIGVETLAGVKRCEILPSGDVRVGMGAPRFDPESAGFLAEHASAIERKGELIVALIDGIRGGIVSVGTPNFVAYGDSPVSIAYATVHGQQIETHRAFRNRINVQFATRTSPDRVVVRCWERGAGLTDACGTGACAVFAVGRAKGLLDKTATISLPGGELRIEVDDSGELYKTGPATIVFEGDWLG